MRSAPWFGSIMIMRFFKLWILLLFRWVCCTKAVFYFNACDSDGNCDWYPNSVYSGCVDWIILHFSYFDLSSSLDLTCSTVQQIQIESSDCSCDSLRRVLKGDHLPELIIGRSVCVSSNSCTFLTYSISTSSVLRNLTIAFNEMLTPSTSICWYLFIYYFCCCCLQVPITVSRESSTLMATTSRPAAGGHESQVDCYLIQWIFPVHSYNTFSVYLHELWAVPNS